MNKKMTAGKAAGIVFCILALVCTVFLILLNSYFGGQMKTINKFFTAVERNDFNSYKTCFSGSDAEDLTEADIEEDRRIGEVIEDTEDLRMDVSFKGREKLENGKYSVTFDIVVYNDSEKETLKNVSRVLARENGKWVIVDEDKNS